IKETLDGLQDAADRNALRVELGRALLASESRAEEAVAVLRDALIDDPSHEEALTLLMGHLEQRGERDEIIELLREQLAAAKDRGDAQTVRVNAFKLGSMLEPLDAADVYRDALAYGDDARLLRTLL